MNAKGEKANRDFINYTRFRDFSDRIKMTENILSNIPG